MGRPSQPSSETVNALSREVSGRESGRTRDDDTPAGGWCLRLAQYYTKVRILRDPHTARRGMHTPYAQAQAQAQCSGSRMHTSGRLGELSVEYVLRGSEYVLPAQATPMFGTDHLAVAPRWLERASACAGAHSAPSCSCTVQLYGWNFVPRARARSLFRLTSILRGRSHLRGSRLRILPMISAAKYLQSACARRKLR
jgi:hypothetical protein